VMFGATSWSVFSVVCGFFGKAARWDSAPYRRGRREGAFELVAHAGDDAEKGVLGEVLGFSVLEFGTIALIVLDEGFELLLLGTEQALAQPFEFHLAEVFDFETEVLVPAKEGAFADADFVGDAVEAPAFDAEFDEFIFGFVGVHESVES
jgi:hypothetical protein